MINLKNNTINMIVNNVGWVLIFIVLLLSIYDISNILSYTLSASILYITIMIKIYLNHKIEKERLDSLDINKIGLSTDNNKNIMDILQEYVEICFDRDVLFFDPIEHDDYIDQVTEKRLLDALIDSVLINMSMDMKIKLARYIGEDNLSLILGKRCATIVTIFVATHNQAIYKGDKDNKVIL